FLLSRGLGFVYSYLVPKGSFDADWRRALRYLSTFVLPSLVVYLLLVKLVERRRMTELAPQQWTGVLKGLVGGFLLFSAAVGLLW
ncbi:hypothetical protein, partial [Mesorhizobium japonicum]|uniref:hypothetical protein n=1 Tax=Mesorhizobium japonicum TaxID=2066070 RepID=UPI003B5B0334